MPDQQIVKTDHTISHEMIYIGLAGGLLLIAYHFFFWDLVDFFSPFLIPVLMIAAWGIFALFCISALVHGCSQCRAQKWRAFLPLSILLVAIPLAVLPPWTRINLYLDFHLKRMQREKVARMVFAGELKPKESGALKTIALPWRYRYLSKGGEIWIDKTQDSTQIFFLTFRGILDSYAGFIYYPEDSDPSEEITGGQVVQMQQMGKNWVWVSCH